MTPSRTGRAAAVFAVVLAAGCDGKVPTYPVRGQVVYAGGKPFRGGGGLTVWFESVAPPHHRASGEVAEDGTFVLSYIEAGSGAPEGEHRVRFDPGATHMQPSAEVALGKKMPPRYLEFRTSGLKQTIARGDNVVTVEVDPPAGK